MQHLLRNLSKTVSYDINRVQEIIHVQKRSRIMKKKLGIAVGIIVVVVAVLFTIHTVNRNKALKNKTVQTAQALLDREKAGKLENDTGEAGEAAQDGIQALIELERYDDAKRIIKKYIAIYPKGIAWAVYYADVLKQQEKWDELAVMIVGYLTDNWKIANVTTKQFALYTDLKDAMGNLDDETKKKAKECIAEVGKNIQIYEKLQKDQNNNSLQKDQKELEILKKAGADNEVFFELYMEYLLQTDQKNAAKEYLDNYEKRGKDKDQTLTYSLESEKISKWKKTIEK